MPKPQAPMPAPAPAPADQLVDQTARMFDCQMAYVAQYIVVENPYHQQLVGNVIYPYVEQICGKELAADVTKHLTEMPIEQIKAFLGGYQQFQIAVGCAQDYILAMKYV